MEVAAVGSAASLTIIVTILALLLVPAAALAQTPPSSPPESEPAASAPAQPERSDPGKGIRPEWREAAENMGATSRTYWRRVALPILAPTLIGTIILLFGNAFGAQATAYQLMSGQIPLVPLLIGSQISGDVLHNPGLGYAMAMGMVAIMGVSIVTYTILQRRAERWRR